MINSNIQVPTDTIYASKPSATVEGLIAEDPFPQSPSDKGHDGEAQGIRDENGTAGRVSTKNFFLVAENHSDVSEEEGWISISHGSLTV